MPKSYARTRRVADLIQTTLAKILQDEATDLNIGMVTITDVNLSQDLSFAKVFVSVLYDDQAEEIISILNDAQKHLRYLLAQEIELRITPELKFIYDDSTVRGHRISSLINNALKK